jgi:hypothetical protein
MRSFHFCFLLVFGCFLPQLGFGATHFIADQLPDGTTLADFNLGTVPAGSADRAVRLVELATLPGNGQIQQITARGGFLYLVLKEGRVWEMDLAGNSEDLLFILALMKMVLFTQCTKNSQTVQIQITVKATCIPNMF